MTKISIVTVCYNAENSIKKTIESVISQKMPCYEYIFIDGNSKDRTNVIIEEYKTLLENKGITCIHISEPDQGIYDAMNKGILLAKGEWIGFLNTGDYYSDDEVFYDLFGKSIDDVDFIYGDSINVKGINSFIRKSYPIEVITYRNPFVHQASFIRAEIAKRFVFNLEYKIAADFEQYVRLYNNGIRFLAVDRVIVVFDLNGISNKKNLSAIIEFEKARKKNGLGLKKIVKRYVIYLGVLIIKNNTQLYDFFIKTRCFLNG